MKRIISALLLLTLWLGACTSSPTAAPALSTESAPGAVTSAPAESAPTENSEQAAAGREAVVSEFENEVMVRAEADGEFISAEVGFIIREGGALQTGANGRARLDLMPEGTIVRVAPNSAFTLPQVVEIEGEPKTTLNLFFGKIFVLLNGGSLDVQTTSGVASVRGSLLSVSINPETGRLQATCLEGHCTLENEVGEEVELVEGESAFVDEDGTVTELDGIDQDEIQEWLDEAPELGEFLEELPDPETYPQFEEFEEYAFDPFTYFEEQTTDDGSGFFFFDEDILPGPNDFGDGGFMDEPLPTDNIGGEQPTQDPAGGGGSTEQPTQDPTGGGSTEEPPPTDVP